MAGAPARPDGRNHQQVAEDLEGAADLLALDRMEFAETMAARERTYTYMARVGYTLIGAGLLNALFSDAPNKGEYSIALFIIGGALALVSAIMPRDMLGVRNMDDALAFANQRMREQNRIAEQREALRGND